jgi:hypothetical protein
VAVLMSGVGSSDAGAASGEEHKRPMRSSPSVMA